VSPGRLEQAARVVLGRRPGPRPRVRLASTATGPATVYFLAPDFAPPSGGVRVMYRHVDILNQAGIRASVLHQRPGFRCTWFENSTSVTDAASTSLGPGDVLVVPEIDVDIVAGLPRPVCHLVLNQSGHLTWKQAASAVSRHYRSGSGLLGMITVSEHSTELMEYAFPGLPIRRVRPSVDPTVFAPGGASRARRLSYLPRRGRQDAALVLALLGARGVLDGWQVEELGGVSQTAFASSMRAGRIVLSLSYQEGFGLPAAEAMACGNYVIGYHGFGGQEFFRPEFSAPVPTGDVLAVARAVEDAVRHDADTGRWCIDRGQEAAGYVLAEYSPDRERQDVLAAYTELLKSP
jgi:Glycosyl transferases group 1